MPKKSNIIGWWSLAAAVALALAYSMYPEAFSGLLHMPPEGAS